MTANLTVPADVWACKQPGVPLVAAIVEGERYADDAMGRTTFTRARPPAWLVVLRDARCETCNGHGTLPEPNGPLPDPYDCADCDGNGRLLHDVLVQTCRCEGGYDDGMQWICEDCDGMPFRTVRCLVDVVPIRHVFDPIDDLAELSVDPVDPRVGSVWLMGHDSDNGPLTPAHVEALAAACGKPPADWVGGYAVILTEVGE